MGLRLDLPGAGLQLRAPLAVPPWVTGWDRPSTTSTLLRPLILSPGSEALTTRVRRRRMIARGFAWMFATYRVDIMVGKRCSPC